MEVSKIFPGMGASPAYKSLERELNSGAYGGDAKLRPWILYDTIALATGTVAYPYLANKVGSTGKSIAETNNPTGGKVPAKTKWAFDAIMILVTPAAAVTHANKRLYDLFLDSFRAELKFQGLSNEHEFPLSVIMRNSNPIIALGAGVGDQMSTSNPTIGCHYFGDVPILFGENDDYQAQIAGGIATDAAVNTWRLKIAYVGYQLTAN